MPLVSCLCATVVGVAVVTLSMVLSPEETGGLVLLKGTLVLGGLADLSSWVLLVVEVGLPTLVLTLEPGSDVGVDVGDWTEVLDDTVLDSVEESVVAVVIPLNTVDALLVVVVQESVACLVVDETVVLTALSWERDGGDSSSSSSAESARVGRMVVLSLGLGAGGCSAGAGSRVWAAGA